MGPTLACFSWRGILDLAPLDRARAAAAAGMSRPVHADSVGIGVTPDRHRVWATRAIAGCAWLDQKVGRHAAEPAHTAADAHA